jgi:hypothetical protein
MRETVYMVFENPGDPDKIYLGIISILWHDGCANIACVFFEIIEPLIDFTRIQRKRL